LRPKPVFPQSVHFTFPFIFPLKKKRAKEVKRDYAEKTAPKRKEIFSQKEDCLASLLELG
jgi:hypothetical protein